jgi:hypothetical protein
MPENQIRLQRAKELFHQTLAEGTSEPFSIVDLDLEYDDDASDELLKTTLVEKLRSFTTTNVGKYHLSQYVPKLGGVVVQIQPSAKGATKGRGTVTIRLSSAPVLDTDDEEDIMLTTMVQDPVGGSCPIHCPILVDSGSSTTNMRQNGDWIEVKMDGVPAWVNPKTKQTTRRNPVDGAPVLGQQAPAFGDSTTPAQMMQRMIMMQRPQMASQIQSEQNQHVQMIQPHMARQQMVQQQMQSSQMPRQRITRDMLASFYNRYSLAQLDSVDEIIAWFDRNPDKDLNQELRERYGEGPVEFCTRSMQQQMMQQNQYLLQQQGHPCHPQQFSKEHMQPQLFRQHQHQQLMARTAPEQHQLSIGSFFGRQQPGFDTPAPVFGAAAPAGFGAAALAGFGAAPAPEFQFLGSGEGFGGGASGHSNCNYQTSAPAFRNGRSTNTVGLNAQCDLAPECTTQ